MAGHVLLSGTSRRAGSSGIVGVVADLMAVRRANAADAAELVRLRHAMFLAMAATGAAASPDHVEDDSWYPAARTAIVDKMARGVLAAFVIDAPGSGPCSAPGHLIGCAVAALEERLPGPGFPRGVSGSMSSVFVEPVYRGRGLGRALVGAALEWLDGHGAELIDLHATPDAERLYRSFGFDEPRSLPLRRRQPDPGRR